MILCQKKVYKIHAGYVFESILQLKLFDNEPYIF